MLLQIFSKFVRRSISIFQSIAADVLVPMKTQHQLLTHWHKMTHIYVSKLSIIGSDNGLSPGWRQALMCTNAGIMLIGPLGTNFSEILIEIQTFSFKIRRNGSHFFSASVREIAYIIMRFMSEVYNHASHAHFWSCLPKDIYERIT